MINHAAQAGSASGLHTQQLPAPLAPCKGAGMPRAPPPAPYVPLRVSGRAKPDTAWDELMATAHVNGFHRVALFDANG